MGLPVEFNWVLALRENASANRLPMECVPSPPRVNGTYDFLKQGYRIYPIGKEIPLIITTGDQNFTKRLGKVIVFYVAITSELEQFKQESPIKFPNQKYPIQTVGSYRILSLNND